MTKRGAKSAKPIRKAKDLVEYLLDMAVDVGEGRVDAARAKNVARVVREATRAMDSARMTAELHGKVPEHLVEYIGD